MMKFLAVGLAAMLAMSAGVSAQTAGSVDSPNTPTTEGSQSVQTACILQTLSFSNGFQLVGDFKYNTFNYQCSCAGMTSTSTTATLGFGSADSSGEVTVNDVKLNFRTMGNAISRAGNVASSPRAGTSSPIVIKDNYANKIVIGVGCNGKGTPTTCYYQYTIKCTKGKPGYVVGDPQFVGLRGQSYQIHGVSNHIYNIVSDKDLQYNSRFVFLNSGKCPVVDGKKQKGCWSHPGSYLGELGLKTRAGDRVHIKTGSAKQGFKAIEINGKAMEVGESIVLADNMGSVSMNSTHVVSVNIGNWGFEFENSDHFVNQRAHVIDSRGLRAHGLLGQTWRETTYPNAIKYVQGEVEDYAVHDDDIFGDNFVFNNHN